MVLHQADSVKKSSGGIVTIGDNVADRYLENGLMFPGGQCVNVSVYAAMLGFPSAHIGILGEDDGGRMILDSLTEHGVDTSHIRMVPGQNAYVLVRHNAAERIFCGNNQQGVSRSHPLTFCSEDLDYLRQFSVLYTNWNSFTDQHLAFLHTAGIPIVYDYAHFPDKEHIDATAPCLTVASFSAGTFTAGKREDLLRYLASEGVLFCIATAGEKGSYVLSGGPKGKEYYQPASFAEKTVDTNGAGDAYLTAFVCYLLEHGFQESAVPGAMKAGSDFAARVVGILGAFGEGRQDTLPMSK